MPPFPPPKFAYDYDVQAELAALRSYRDTAPGRILPDAAIISGVVPVVVIAPTSAPAFNSTSTIAALPFFAAETVNARANDVDELKSLRSDTWNSYVRAPA